MECLFVCKTRCPRTVIASLSPLVATLQTREEKGTDAIISLPLTSPPPVPLIAALVAVPSTINYSLLYDTLPPSFVSPIDAAGRSLLAQLPPPITLTHTRALTYTHTQFAH